MAVVSKYFANLDLNKFKQETDYFINRLVGQNRFVSASTYMSPWPNPSGDRYCMYGLVWFREATDKAVEDEFPDLKQLTFISDEVLAKMPELERINRVEPLVLDEKESS